MGASSARRADWLRARRTRRVFTPHIDHDAADVPDLDWHDDVYSGPDVDDGGRHQPADRPHGGDDIYDIHDPAGHVINDDDDDDIAARLNDYVLVSRADYDNLVAAFNEHAHDYIHHDLYNAARRLINNHVIDLIVGHFKHVDPA
jgi:hypothetical protein